MVTFAILAFIAALCSCDITMFGQFMISRPIFVGGLFGIITGNIHMGLWMGMIVEMIWTNEIPMGSSVPIDLTMMTILPIVWTATSIKGSQEAAIFALVLTVPFVYLYREIDLKGRLFNTRIMRWVEVGIEQGKEGRIVASVFVGLLLFMLRATLTYFLFFVIGDLIFRQMFYYLPTEVLLGLKKAWLYLPVAGFGAVLYNFRTLRFPSVHR